MLTQSRLNSVPSIDLAIRINALREIIPDAPALAQANVESVLNFLAGLEASDNFIRVDYALGSIIVESGRLADEGLVQRSEYSYALVPLGLIVQGEISVTKGGKATKRLSAGDFIGLFETSDWLLTDKRRSIGEWTLQTTEDTEIIYFSKTQLKGQSARSKQFVEYLIGNARKDRVPQPITELPLLDWVANHTTKSRLQDYAIVINTHILPNYMPFFRHLAYLVPMGRLFVLEKAYSTVPDAYRSLIEAGCEVVQVKMEPGLPYDYAATKSLDVLWSKVSEEKAKGQFSKMLIISDGGDLLTSIPWDRLQGVSITAVEQTQRGIARIETSNRQLPPIVSVASTGIKKTLESQMIAHSVIAKLQEFQLFTPGQKVGVIGAGSIGSTIIHLLMQMNLDVSYYDSTHYEDNMSGATIKVSLDSLLNDCDLIIGTTGTDALRGIAFERAHGHKILVSASSADVEFYTVLKLAPLTDQPFDTRKLSLHDDLTVEILNGGYPINFDRNGDAAPSEDIVLTYSLMYIAAMEAVELIRQQQLKPAFYDLDKVAQRQLLIEWLRSKHETNDPIELTEGQIDQILSSSSLPDGLMGPPVWLETMN
jgi:S-adenosylhomocysteine hydrolase